MPTRLANLKPGEVSFVPRGANEQEFLITKEDGSVSNPALEKVLKEAGVTDAAVIAKCVTGLVPVLKAESDTAAKEAAVKAKADAEAEMQAKLDEQKKKDNPFADGPVQKEDGSWDFAKVPAGSVSIWKEKIASDLRVAKVEKELADERNLRVTKEFHDKAGQFKHLGVKTEDLGLVMKSLSEKAPEAFKVFEPILKAMDEKIAKSGFFAESGTSTPGGAPAARPGQTEAEAAIETIAKGIVEKDGTGKLTREQAVAKAWQQNPKLYDQHRVETDRRKKSA